MANTIRTFEELSMNAHPCLNTMCIDNWLLRLGGGYTYRANSVNILGPSTVAIEDKVDFCESVYRQHNLPTIFKLMPLWTGLDTELEQRGYRIEASTNVMTMSMPPLDSPHEDVVVADGITEQWQDCCFGMHQTPAQQIPVAKRIQENIVNRTLSAIVFAGDEAVASGLCVVEREYAGLLEIVVSPGHRRRGHARKLCTSLLAAAAGHGAKTAYLQVVADNDKARDLYKSMGFSHLYTYWYRVKP